MAKTLKSQKVDLMINTLTKTNLKLNIYEKTFTILFSNIFTNLLFAQDTPNDFAQRVQYIFQHVDASYVNTGLLMDCGSEFVNMENFTGLTSVNDSNYVNINTWRSVYASLYTAKFNNNINLTDFPTFNATLKAAISNTLPIGIQ